MTCDFNDGWLFQKEGQPGESVDLPHDAMITEVRNASCRNGVNTGFFPGGKYVYTKYWKVNPEWLEKSVRIHFEGVYQNCHIFLNEVEVGSHKYGYTPFDIDLTGWLQVGENCLRLMVDNSLEPNCRWYSGAGIYRPVQLIVEEKQHIERIRVKTLAINPAVISVDVIGDSLEAVTVSIFDRSHILYEGEPGKITLQQVQLWSDETPKLYTCIAKCKTDEKRLDFGIRKLEWSAEKGLLVNEKEILLRGGCIHHDHGVLGACEFWDAEERRIRILKDAGFNAIRMAHHPASQILLSICDRLGMYVMNETFDGWYVPKTYHDYARYFDECWKADVRSMVESAENHPSVIMYSIGNEVSETATPKGIKVCRMIQDYVHGLDDTRPVTAGINVLLNVYAHMGIGVYRDKGEYQPKPLPPGKSYHDKKSGSAFFNAMAQKLGPLMFFMSKGRHGDKACAPAGDVLDIIGLNYASSRYDEDAKKYPERMMVGSETMVADLPYNWSRVKKYPQLVGDFVWSAWDYLGEACIGDWTYHSYKGLPLLAGQGMIDITGKALASMYYMQIVWGLRKKPFIAVSPLNHADETPTKGAWQFTNAIDSWSWEGYEGVKTTVEVYAAGESVRLFLNDRLIGCRRLKKFKASFSLVYQPGVLRAEALDTNGNVIAQHFLGTAQKETILWAEAEKKELRANGQDLCYVPIEFTDKKHCLKPYIEKRVDIAVEGCVSLAGFGSALCKTNEVFDRNHHMAYRGRCLAVLRAKNEQGKAKVSISAEGVEPVVIRLEVK